MFSVVLVLLEMQKASQSAFLVAVGTSLSKRTLWKKLLEFMVMTITSNPSKRWRTAGELTATRGGRQVRTIAEGAGLTEINTCTDNSWSSGSLPYQQLNGAHVANDCGSFVLRHDLRNLGYCSYNVARKNKDLALYEIGKVFEQIQIKEDCQMKSTACPLLDWFSCWKDFQTPVPVDFLLC